MLYVFKARALDYHSRFIRRCPLACVDFRVAHSLQESLALITYNSPSILAWA